MRSSFRRRGGPICLANEEEEEEDRYLGWINHIWPSQSVIERSIRFLSMIKKIRVIYNLDNFWKVVSERTKNAKSKGIPRTFHRYGYVGQENKRLDGAQETERTQCGSMRIIHQSNLSFFPFLFLSRFLRAN